MGALDTLLKGYKEPEEEEEKKQPAMSGAMAALLGVQAEEPKKQTPEKPASASDYDSLLLPTPQQWVERIGDGIRKAGDWLKSYTAEPEKATVATGIGKATPGAAGGGGRGKTTAEDVARMEAEKKAAERYAAAVQPTSDMYLSKTTAELADYQQKEADRARAKAEELSEKIEKSPIEQQREKTREAYREARAFQPTSDMYLNKRTAEAAEEMQKTADEAKARGDEANEKLHEMGGRYGLKEDLQTIGENLVAGGGTAVRGIANALNYAGQEMTRGQLMEQQSVMSGLPGQQEIADSSAKTLQEVKDRGLQSVEQTYDTLGIKAVGKAGRAIQDFAQKAAQHAQASGKVAQALAQTANGVGGMVPSILSNLVIPGSSLWVMGAQAAGNATEEALAAGAQDEKAVLYGGAVAAVEVLTEKLFGGIPGLNVGSLDDAIESVIKKNIGSEAAQRAILFLVDALGEGAEEFISECADWGLNKWLVGSDKRSLDEVRRDAWYSAFIGALTSVAMSGPAELVKSWSPRQIAQKVAQEMNARMETERKAEAMKLPEVQQTTENAAQGRTAEDLALPTPEEGGEKRIVILKGPSAIEEEKGLGRILARNIDKISDMDSVADLTGFEMKEPGKKASQVITDFFAKVGNKVFRKGLGDVALGEYGLGGVLNHKPLNRAKMVTLAAVPQVIESGRIINDDPNWKGRGYRSITFAAPVNVAGKPLYVAAVVDQRPDNKFYLNEVVDSEGNYVRITEETPFDDTKSGVPADSGITATPGGVSTKSITPSAQEVKNDLALPAVPAQQQTAAQPQDLSLPSPEQVAKGTTAQQQAEPKAQEQTRDLGLPTPEEWRNRGAEPQPVEMETEEPAATPGEPAAPGGPATPEQMSDGGYSQNGYAASPGLRKLGVKIAEPITNTIGADVLVAQAQKAKAAERALNKAIKKLAPTKAEKALAQGLADGTYTEGNGILYGKDGAPIRDVNMNKVRELAEYYRQKNQYKRDRIAEQRRANRDRETAIDEDLLKNADNFKKMSALRLNLNTMKRNMLAWAGQTLGAKINQHLFDPVTQNSAERIRFVNRMLDRVREFHLTKAESEMVQRVIEGTAVQDQVSKLTEDARRRVNAAAESNDLNLTAAEYNLSAEEKKLAQRYHDWLQTQAQLKNMDADKINAAAKAYSDAYSDFYTAINEFLVMHGYEPIGFIQGYAPHLQPDNVQSTLGKVMSIFGLDAEVSALPTDIAGQTENYKPGKQWNPYFQHRAGADSMIDAVAGYESYVNYLSNVLYHTDDIQKLRVFIRTLRGMYASEEIREKLDQAKWIKGRSAEEKADFLRINKMIDEGTQLTPEMANDLIDKYVDGLYDSIENKTKHGDVASVLEDYTNKLAGKQTKLDRAVESFFGRRNINFGNALSRIFGESAVVGNLSSALNQLSQLPAVQAEVGNKYVLQAIGDIIRGNAANMDQESDFLTGKLGTDSLLAERSWKDSDSKQRHAKVTNAMSIPFEAVDTLASRLYVRAKYLQEIENGATHEAAMKAADNFAERVVGNRIQGSRPMVFESKNAFVKLFSTFQLEVANAWAHISQDLPAEIKAVEKSQGKAAAVQRTAAILMRYGISAFLLNRLTDAIYGGTPAPFDLIGYVLGGIAEGKGESVNEYLIQLVSDLFGLGGDDDDDEDEEFDVGAALKETGSLLVGDMPYIRNAASMLGYGDTTLPLPSVGKTAKSLSDLISGKGSWGDLGESALRDAATWLPGGNQAKKTAQGIETIAKQGRYNKSGNLMYPVDMSGAEGLAKAMKAGLFGPSSLGATDSYYASGDKALSDKQTAAYEELVKIGEDRDAVYDTIMRFRKVEDVKDSDEDGKKKRDVLRNAEMSDYSKARLYETLFSSEGSYEKLAGLMDTGITFDDCMDILDKYNEQKYTGEKPGIQASRFAQWVDQTYEPEVAEKIKEQYSYWTNVRAEPGAYEKAQAAGVDIETAAEAGEAINAAKGKKDEEGDTISGTVKADAIRAADTLDCSEDEKIRLLEASDYKMDGYKGVSGFMSLTEYADALEVKALAKGKKDEKGNTIDNSKRLEVMQEVNKKDLKPGQKTQVMEALGYEMGREGDAPPIWYTRYSGKDYEAYYYMSDSRRKAYKEKASWMSPSEFAECVRIDDEAKGEKGLDGEVISGSKKLEVMEGINKIQMSPLKKTQVMEALGYEMDGDNKARPIWETDYSGKDYEAYYYMTDGQRKTYGQYCDWMPVADYAKYADSIGDFHDIKDKNGKTTASRKSQVIEYINALDLTPDQKTALYVASGYNANLTDKGFADCPWWNRLALRSEYYPTK